MGGSQLAERHSEHKPKCRSTALGKTTLPFNGTVTDTLFGTCICAVVQVWRRSRKNSTPSQRLNSFFKALLLQLLLLMMMIEINM